MMNYRTLLLSATLLISSLNALGKASSPSEIIVTPGEYLVTAVIQMPNLEESLRYTTTKTRQCLSRENASSLFSVLEHVSFSGCSLVEKHSEGEYEKFDLVCINPNAATGSASFAVKEEIFHATLKVKMGGKNMKFSQRVSGHRIGNCE